MKRLIAWISNIPHLFGKLCLNTIMKEKKGRNNDEE